MTVLERSPTSDVDGEPSEYQQQERDDAERDDHPAHGLPGDGPEQDDGEDDEQQNNEGHGHGGTKLGLGLLTVYSAKTPQQIRRKEEKNNAQEPTD